METRWLEETWFTAPFGSPTLAATAAEIFPATFTPECSFGSGVMVLLTTFLIRIASQFPPEVFAKLRRLRLWSLFDLPVTGRKPHRYFAPIG